MTFVQLNVNQTYRGCPKYLENGLVFFVTVSYNQGWTALVVRYFLFCKISIFRAKISYSHFKIALNNFCVLKVLNVKINKVVKSRRTRSLNRRFFFKFVFICRSEFQSFLHLISFSWLSVQFNLCCWYYISGFIFRLYNLLTLISVLLKLKVMVWI